ncbi:MAG: DUF3102 domain-containing protein [Planctomycetota bacterium]
MIDSLSPPAIVLIDLASYAQAIQAEHRACCAAASQSLDHAMLCGDLLSKAKAEVPHGQWQAWLADNFPASARTAQQYMRLSKNREAIEAKAQAAALLTIEDAAELLADKSSSAELERLESVIEGGIDDARAIAEELVSIERSGDWHKRYETFEDYLEDRFRGQVSVEDVRLVMDVVIIDRCTAYREHADRRPDLLDASGDWRDDFRDDRLPSLDGKAYLGFLAPRHQVQIWPSTRHPGYSYVSHVEWFEGDDAGGLQCETKRPVRLNHALLTWLIEVEHGLAVGGDWILIDRPLLPLPEGAE